MTRPIDVEQELDRWFADGPDGVADRVIDAALTDIGSTSQRSAGFGGPWRALPMSRTAFSVAAVVVVIVVGAVAIGLVLRPPGAPSVGVPTASTAPASPATVPPSAAACAIPIQLGQQFSVPDCRYATAILRPVLSFGGVAGWRPAIETARGLLFQAVLPGGRPTAEGLAIFTVDRLAAKPCAKTPPRADTTPLVTVPFRPSSPGSGPSEFFAWLAKTPLSGTPTAMSIGGHAGLAVTFDAADGSLAACGGAVDITWTSDTPGELGAEGIGEGRTRLIAIDVDGATVVFEVYTTKDRFAAVNAAADDLLATLQTP